MAAIDTVHVVCPHCDKTNRIPAARSDEGPKCGQCHQPLFTGHTLDLTAGNFQQHIGHSDIPVVVDFWASWCGPCQMMAPQYAAAAAELEPRFRLAKVDTDAQSVLANEFRIRSIPTMALFKAGREVARQSGAMSKSDIVRWVRAHA